MKRISWIPAIISLALLAGCAPNLNKDTEVIKETQESDEATTIIPSMQISDQYYRTLLPYEESKSRGMIVSRVYSKYDIKEAENGLLRLSQRNFSPDDYFFQEGQMLDSEILTKWLSRKSSENEEGLNPSNPDPKGKITPEIAKNAPIYLAHIVEQNFLVKKDDKKVQLGGVSIGLALNTVFYYQTAVGEPILEAPIPNATVEENGKKMAQEVVKRMRSVKGLENVPITVGLFKQESRNSIVPGTYFTYSVATEGKAQLGDWTNINEEYVLFPQPQSEEKYRDVGQAFTNFKQDVEEYFSNFTSIVGTGFYQDDRIKKLTIDIPIQFYGEAEIIGFTQYMTGLIMEHFPTSMHVEVNVTSINGPEALVIKKANETEPFVHIYHK